ncbi:hypothetical protein GCM10009789_04850 [Kribbella sancticallisti]|uniref:DUF998 domain-containing protein n=1 Tax=Kribbella sancticallisti TaxID=460087 RepID=A0ABN2C8C9_9ACTN
MLGVAGGLFLIFYPAAVDDGRYSYPLTATGFAIIQLVFCVQHLGLVVLLAALWTSGAAGRSGVGRIGVGGSVLAMLGLAAVEVAAISARDSLYPSPETDTLDIWYGVTSMGIGVFLILAGIAVLRAKAWSGWPRYLPLALGIYVFVPLTPGILGPWVVARLAITGWMVLFAVLGWTLLRRGTR